MGLPNKTIQVESCLSRTRKRPKRAGTRCRDICCFHPWWLMMFDWYIVGFFFFSLMGSKKVLLWRYGCGFSWSPEGDFCWHVEFGKKADPPKKKLNFANLTGFETSFNSGRNCVTHSFIPFGCRWMVLYGPRQIQVCWAFLACYFANVPAFVILPAGPCGMIGCARSAAAALWSQREKAF